nr:hypothetical protein [uncultured Flavobacterium sp.]
MEKDNWIQKVINSTNGMTTVTPSDDLLFKIKQKIQQQDKVSPTTVWLVAASIAVLAALNLTLLNQKSKAKENTATVYLENTLNKSNQLY